MYNILVCDDEKDIVTALEIYLRNDDYKIFKAYNGADALKILTEEEIHLVLLDIMMPKMDGHQAAKAIRAMYADRPDAEEIPIIALSANAFSEDVQASLDAGMNGHVSKPLNMEEVTKVIERNLNRP